MSFPTLEQRPVTVRSVKCLISDDSHKLGTGCPELDRFLRGGLPCRGITEISGEGASGKSQLCLQMSLAIQKSLNRGAALYICTEDAFPIKRLQQLIDEIDKAATHADKKSYSDNVFIEHVEDVDCLLECLQNKLPVLIARHHVKLLIIDSIAGAFRSQYESEEAVNRAQKLYLVGSILHSFNSRHGIFIVCTNQVTDVISEDGCVHSEGTKVPALGLVWSNIVNTRIMLSRTNVVHQRSLTLPGTEDSIRFDIVKRKLTILFSPTLPSSHCLFIVNLSGVHALTEE